MIWFGPVVTSRLGSFIASKMTGMWLLQRYYIHIMVVNQGLHVFSLYGILCLIFRSWRGQKVIGMMRQARATLFFAEFVAFVMELWRANGIAGFSVRKFEMWTQPVPIVRTFWYFDFTSCVHGSLYAMSERTWEIIRHKAKQLEIRLSSAWNTFLTKTSATANRRMGYPEDSSKQNWKLCSWVTSALFVGATLMLSYLLVTVNYRYVVACKILCPNISETIINSPLVQVLKCSIFWKSRPKLGKTEYDCRIVDGCRWLCKDQNPKKALDAIALN